MAIQETARVTERRIELDEHMKNALTHRLQIIAERLKGHPEIAIICFGMGLTLRGGNREYFYQQLDRSFPSLKEKYIKSYGNSYEVTSGNNEYLMNLIKTTCEQNDILFGVENIFNYMNEFEEKQYEQMKLDL